MNQTPYIIRQLDGVRRSGALKKIAALAVRSALNAARFPKGFLNGILCGKDKIIKQSEIRDI